MAVIVVQMGHVGRATGKTGTWREKELNQALGERLRPLLAAAGHHAHLMGADDPLPTSNGDVFVSLHGDSGNAQVARSGASSKRGACVGYPDADGGRMAGAWKEAHVAAGWPGGLLGDNNTTGLSQYYMWGRSNRTRGFRFRYLAEHATLTNSADEAWIFSHLDAAAAAHVNAIARIVGGAGPVVIDTGVTHVVGPGETLFAIGRRFGVSAAEIQRLNGISDPTRLRVGQRLTIPNTGGSGPPATLTHTVQPGETLFAIGRRFGVSAAEIQRLNGITDPTMLRVGQVLRIR